MAEFRVCRHKVRDPETGEVKVVEVRSQIVGTTGTKAAPRLKSTPKKPAIAPVNDTPAETIDDVSPVD